MKLGEIEERWQRYRTKAAREWFWRNILACPKQRGIFSACASSDADELRTWLSDPAKAEILDFPGPDLSRIARMHLLCALAAHSPSAKNDLRKAANSANLCEGFVRDLEAELRGERLPAVRDAVVSALFVDNTGAERSGALGRLTFELVSGGAGRLYRSPHMAFVLRDQEFRNAETGSHDFVKSLGLWDHGCDVRWRLDRPDGKALPLQLIGDSTGGTFAFGLAKLLSGQGLAGQGTDRRILHRIREVDLSGVAVMAAVQPGGGLCKVGGQFDKLLAATRDRSLPRIHTVVAAEEQRADIKNIDSSLLDSKPYAGFRAICAGSIADALDQLEADNETRWGSVDCTMPVRVVDFVGRDELFKAVDAFIANNDSGYLVIVGGMGKGKSAFMAEMIHRRAESGEVPVYHIIEYQSSTGERRNIAGCLYSRLRRKYASPEPREWEQQKVESRLQQLLKHLSVTELGETQKEVLFLDAADQAEAGEGSPLLPDVLRKLPPGVLCIITSRANVAWLQTWEAVTICGLDDYVDDRSDVRKYLELRAAMAIPLSSEFIGEIVNQSDPPIMMTVEMNLRRLGDPMESDEAKGQLLTDPKLWCIPPDDLIKTEAARALGKARAHGISKYRFWETLGLLAVARESLSESVLDDFGLWERGTTDLVLECASNSFRLRPPLGRPDVPYVFEHPGYQREILTHLTLNEAQECNRVLAEGCENWAKLTGQAREYALRHLPYHYFEAHDTGNMQYALSNQAFINERFDAGMVDDAVADMKRAEDAGVSADIISAALIRGLQERPEEPGSFWLQLRSALYQTFGTYDDWPESLRTQLERSRNLRIMLFLGETHDMARDYDRAESVFRRMVEITSMASDPKSFCTARVRLATALDHQGRPEEGLEVLTSLLKRPGLKQAVPESYYWWAHYQKGICLRRLGKYRAAKKEFEAVREGLPNHDNAISALHQLGVIDIALGDLDSAEARFGECLEKRMQSGPWHHRVAYDHHRLGEVHDLRGEPDEAREHYQDAIKISTACGNLRYIAEVIATYLKIRGMPEVVVMADLARQLGTNVHEVASTLRHLGREGASYLPELDRRSAEPTGHAVRWDSAHEQGVCHGTVSVIVVDEDGTIAVQKRFEAESTGKGDVSASGHVEPGEDDISAAARELKEELGISVSRERLVRIGKSYEFRKQGSPRVKADAHSTRNCYVYRTNRRNLERISVFLVGLSNKEKSRLSREVKWLTVTQCMQEARENPEDYASSFRQVFGHDYPVKLLRSAADEALSH